MAWMDRTVGIVGLAICAVWSAAMFQRHELMEAWPIWALAGIAFAFLVMLFASADLIGRRTA